MAEKTQMMSNKIGIVMLVIASAAQLGLSTPIYDYASVLCAEDEALIGQKAQELLNARGWTAAVVTYARPIPQVGGNAEPWAAAQTNTVVFYMPVNASGGVPRLGVSPDLEAVLPGPIRAWIAQEEMAAPHHALDICAAVVAGIEALLLDRVQLSSVTFEEGYAIKDASVPQWGYTGAEGEEVLSAHPVCYKRQDEMKLRPVFSYLGPPPVGDIKIRARANGEDYIVAGSLSAGSTIQPSGALIAIGTGGAVDYRPDFQVDWALSFDGGASWEVMGRSADNDLYVVHDQPGYLGSYELDERLLYFSCRVSSGMEDKADVFSSLWSRFEALGTGMSSDEFVKDGGQNQLSYYGTADPERSWVGLVHFGDGECTSWARLFEGLLRHQGFSSGEDGDFRLATLRPVLHVQEGMAIKNWHFSPASGTSYSGAAGRVFSHKNLSPGPEIQPEFNNGLPTGYCRWLSKEAWGLPGIPAQGNLNPVSYFRWHELIELAIEGTGMVKYYDPSYGLSYNTDDQLKDSVDGIYLETFQAENIIINGQNRQGYKVYFRNNLDPADLEIR